VDLNRDDNRTLLAKLQNLMKQEDQNIASRFLSTSNHILRLQAGEDKLIQQCELWVHVQIKAAENEKRKFVEQETNFTAKESAWEAQHVDPALRADQDLEKELMDLSQEQTNTQGRVDKFQADVKSMEETRQKLTDRLEINKRVLYIFDNELLPSDMVIYRCDMSREATGLLRTPYHRLDLQAVLPSAGGRVESWVALILRADRADEILTRFSLYLPKSLEDFDNVEGDGVLHNSRNGYNPHNLVVKMIGCVLTTTIELSFKFNVYLYSSRKFDSMTPHKMLREEFSRPIEKDGNEIQECNKKIQKRGEENNKDGQRLVVLAEQIPAMKQRVERSRTLLEAKKRDVSQFCQHFFAALAIIEGALESLEKEKIKEVLEISKILEINKIAANLTSVLHQFHYVNGDALTRTIGLRDRVKAFEAKICAKIDSRFPSNRGNGDLGNVADTSGRKRQGRSDDDQGIEEGERRRQRQHPNQTGTFD